mmetsp:Transcript_2993/g.4635  ORF Transcript_2993/g.4635 Transcript_2993/m.4635 type:complete len:239 (+) Transcript_2993:62-778(+)
MNNPSTPAAQGDPLRHQQRSIPDSNKTTNKKAVVHSSSSTTSKLTKDRLNFVNKDEKSKIVSKITRCVEQGAKLGINMVIGFNSVLRLLEENSRQEFILEQTSRKSANLIICVSRDGDPTIVNQLVHCAAINAVPCLAIPKLSFALKLIFKVKSVSCIAFLNASAASRRSSLQKNKLSKINGGERQVGTKTAGPMKEVPSSSLAPAEGAERDTEEDHSYHSMLANIDDLRDYLLHLCR